MGRELRRVPLDFSWELSKVWEGFLNPHHATIDCAACQGSGSSPEALRLKALWYGNLPFDPRSKGSEPFTADHPKVIAFARRNLAAAPQFYGTDTGAEAREARRLADLFNESWSHHLDQDDVDALVAEGRLTSFTHHFVEGEGWLKNAERQPPTPREVNEWSISGGLGHDAINAWVVIAASCKRRQIAAECANCGGQGFTWTSEEARLKQEAWTPTPPPEGEGYQIWETVSEGSPISPVFAAPESLARWMSESRWGADVGTSYEAWLRFIHGPGWAPTLVLREEKLMTGVEAIDGH